MATLTISGDTTFSVNDILRIKDSSNDEWMQVTAVNGNIYTVTRDLDEQYASNNNPIWTKGTSITNYGASGEGGIFMTSDSTPYIDVLTHAGSPWTTTTTHMRMGNLNGFLGYSSDLYGIAIGETNAYLKYDPTNGLRIKGLITAESGSTTADIDSYTKLLIHFDGIDARTAYVAETGQTCTFVGTAQLDTAQKKFGASSLLLDGNSDYVTLPDSADWDFGTGDFTVDFWIRIANADTVNTVYSHGKYNESGSMRIIVTPTFIQVILDTTIINYTESFSVNTWHHIAVVRTGDTLKVFSGGAQIGSDEDVSGKDISGHSADLWIGNDANEYTGYYMDGWLDEYRVSKGIARWTSDFDVPVGPYTDSALSIADSWAHASDITKIDGGNIYTETILASAITAGTFVGGIFEVGAGGSFQSSDYVADTTGFKLAPTTGLEINTGIIRSGLTEFPYEASDTLLHSADVSRTVGYTQFNKVKSILCTVSGTLRIKFYINAGGGAATVAKIYRDGVAVGTQRASGGGTFSEDIAGWHLGDEIQAWAYCTDGGQYGTLQNFRVYGDEVIGGGWSTEYDQDV